MTNIASKWMHEIILLLPFFLPHRKLTEGGPGHERLDRTRFREGGRDEEVIGERGEEI